MRLMKTVSKGRRYKTEANIETRKKVVGGGRSYLVATFFDDGTVELESFPNGVSNLGVILTNKAMQELRDLLDARLKANEGR